MNLDFPKRQTLLKQADSNLCFFEYAIVDLPGMTKVMFMREVLSISSDDDGRNWRELGEVMETGKKGKWDSQAVFTPSVIEEKGIYYLYYMGVQSTPGNIASEFENNSVNDFTAIGVTKSKNPVARLYVVYKIRFYW